MTEKMNMTNALIFVGHSLSHSAVSDEDSQTNENSLDEYGILRHENWELGHDARLEVLHFQSHSGLSLFDDVRRNTDAGLKAHTIMEVADADGSKRLYRLLVSV